jgi:prepilin-type N-terminal cleavage/methylation domain-containing protein
MTHEENRIQAHIMDIISKQYLRHSYQGFTMIELLVAMVVALLAMSAIYSTFLNQHRSYQIQEETAEMQQNLRAAMFYMEREIRMAGCDPLGSAHARIIRAEHTLIRFTEDVRGNSSGSAPPIVLNPSGSDVPASKINQIRSVEVTLVARTSDPLLPSKNGRTYFNQRDTKILLPQNDNVSRRRLTTRINCRNLGI